MQGAEDPVFPSRGGRFLSRGRVRIIVRRARERVGVAEPVSLLWLRPAHASHALDPVRLSRMLTTHLRSRHIHHLELEKQQAGFWGGYRPKESESSDRAPFYVPDKTRESTARHAWSPFHGCQNPQADVPFCSYRPFDRAIQSLVVEYPLA
jgi:hypothetical protein